MKIQVVLAMPEAQQVIAIDAPDGCTARDAVVLAVAAGLDFTGSGLHMNTAPLGVYGSHVSDDATLYDGDRVELYRELQQDPKELRRQRARADDHNCPD